MSEAALEDDQARECSTDALLADYLQQAVAGSGRKRLRSAIIEAHPEHGSRLRAFFNAEDQLDGMIGGSLAVTADHDADRGSAEAVGSSPDRFLPGATIGGYQLQSLLGRGGMGSVYKAYHPGLQRTVALKTIRRSLDDPSDQQRLYSEARAAAILQHPGIIAIYEVGEHDGQPFFSMEYVAGQTLAEFAAARPLPEQAAATLARQIAEALDYAHGMGVIHRDIKPSNVIVDASGQPRLADFGLARRLESDSKLTATGTVLGTPCYMAPEQARGELQDVGPLSDVYSLGATLYELLCGRPPFNAASPWEVLCQVLSAEPVSPRLLNPAVSRDLETICLKCLQKRPADRYPTAAALAEELGRFLRGEPILARPVSRVEHAWRWCRRNPKLASASAAALALLATTLIAVSTGYVTTSRALAEAETVSAEARAAVDRFFTQVSENRLLDEPGLQPLRKDLLRDARDYYRRFLETRSRDPALRRDVALAHYRLGWFAHTIDSDDAAAQEEFRAALATLDHCRGEAEAAVLGARGDIWTGLGQTSQELGRTVEARQAYENAIENRQQAAELDDENRPSAGGHPREALRKLANAHMNLGLLGILVQDQRMAEREISAAQAIREDLLRQARRDPAVEMDLAKGYYSMSMLKATTQKDSARAALDNSLALLRRLCDEDPRCLEYRFRQSQCLHRRGELAQSAGEAESDLCQANALLEALTRDNPGVTQYWEERARVAFRLAAAHLSGPNQVRALDRLNESEAACKAALQNSPDNHDCRRLLAETLRCIGRVRLATGDWRQADRTLAEAESELEQILAKAPGEAVQRDARLKLDWVRKKRASIAGKEG